MDTKQAASDVVAQAVEQGKMACYFEADAGNFHIIFPGADYASYAELAYKVADKIAEHNVNPESSESIILRD